MAKKRRKHNNRANTSAGQAAENSTVLNAAEPSEAAAEIAASENEGCAELNAEAENASFAPEYSEPVSEEVPGNGLPDEEISGGAYEDASGAYGYEEIASENASAGETKMYQYYGEDSVTETVDDVFASEALSDTVPINIDEIETEVEHSSSYHNEERSSRSRRKGGHSKGAEDASVSAFISEVFDNIRKFVIEQKRACIIAVAALLFCIGVIVLAGKLSHKETPGETTVVSGNSVGELMTVSGAPLEEDAYPEVVDIVHRYFEARKTGNHDTLRQILNNVDDTKLAQVDAINEYITDFTDIKCFTKQGPYENSYIVYAVYNCTFKDWEAYPAPALLALLVCTDENGTLFIESGEIDDEAAEFVKTVSSQQDVVDLFNRVNTEYQEVIDSDPGFAAYMEELKPKIARDVSVRVAQMREESGTPDGGEGDTVSDNESGEDTQEPEETTGEGDEEDTPAEETPAETTTTFLVEATTAVNVRRSDSENADRIAQIGVGTQLTCVEQRANGWSHVIYNDEDGYIKSDYLKVVGEDNNTQISNSKITVTSTVNVRDSASINGAVVGMAYAGESFELLERGQEWTKIVFNGKTAYVKSDYVSN